MRAYLFSLLVFAPFLACTNLPPERNFEVTLYMIDWESRCLLFKNDNDEIERVCDPDDNFIGIHIDDYKKERDYQSILKRDCKQW